MDKKLDKQIIKFLHQEYCYASFVVFRVWGPFLEVPETCSFLESHGHISNPIITELFYSHILNRDRGFR